MSRYMDWYNRDPRNREKSLERVRKWRAENKERYREYSHQYYEKNKEHILELQRERNYWKAVDELNRRRYTCG